MNKSDKVVIAESLKIIICALVFSLKNNNYNSNMVSALDEKLQYVVKYISEWEWK